MQRPDLTEQFSFSRIGTFSQCAKSYQHRYIDRVKVVGTEAYFLLGKAYHAAQEFFYQNHPGGVCPQEATTELLLAGLDMFWTDFFAEEKITHLRKDFIAHTEKAVDVMRDLAWLEWRGTAECTDKKLAIRRPDGTLYSAVKMTSIYKTEYAKLRLDTRVEKQVADGFVLDEKARQHSPTMQSSGFSLAAVYLEVDDLLRRYSDFPHPFQVDEVLGVEIGFTGDTALTLAGFKVQGFLDLLVRLNGKVTIIDHKTSKAEISPAEVLYHEQLNLYAYAIRETLGIEVEQIGINHARTNVKTIVAIDWNVVDQVVERQAAALRTIANAKEFPTQNPLDKYAAKKCLGFSKAPYDAPSLNSVCPYVDLCHPGFLGRLQDLHKVPDNSQGNPASGQDHPFDLGVTDGATGHTPASVDAMAAELFS